MQTLENFRRQVIDSGLLSSVELAEWLEGLPAEQSPRDAEQLARELVRHKKLTAWQVKAIYQGHGKTLLMGNYVVLDKLGQGGMGVVLKARHRRMNRLVALKVLSPGSTNSPTAIKRFHREVQAAARLEHPNIVTAYDADEAGGKHFLVMQFVDGSDLATLVKQEGRMPVEKAVGCVLQAARGLEYAHQHGVVHRDIKPANLLLQRDGTVKILDMGLARMDAESEACSQLTGTGQIMGTVDFMPPEQAVDTKRADERADIYSLGITLWYLLIGETPYRGDTIMSRLLAHRDHPIPSLCEARPEVSPAVDALFRRMVAKLPEHRYQSMSEVLAAIEACRLNDSAPQLAAQQSDDLLLNDFLNSLRQKEATGTAGTSQTIAPTVEIQCSEVTADYQTSASGDGDTNPPVNVVGSARTIANNSSLAGQTSLPRAWIAVGAGIASVVAAAAIVLSRGEDAPSLEVTSQVSGALNQAPVPPQPALTSGASSKPSGSVEHNSGNPPPHAVVPFDPKQARAHQEAWAKHLGTTVEAKNSQGMTMILLPPGEFVMGATQEQIDEEVAAAKDPVRARQLAATRSDAPAHRVRITRPLRIGAHEVTVAQFRKFVEATGYKTEPEQGFVIAQGFEQGRELLKVDAKFNWRNPGYEQADDHPVVAVTHNDALAYCAWLSEQEGVHYDLPTEAQWEYACRAGAATRHWFDAYDKDFHEVGWLVGRVKWTTRVGSLAPNPFGLYDMVGHVEEWCRDWFRTNFYQDSPVDDPECHWMNSAGHVVRGGSAYTQRSTGRSAHRGVFPGTTAMIGFRVVCDVKAASAATASLAKPDESRVAAAWHGWPADAPPPARAPFDATQARRHQEAWANYLGVPVEYTNSIGMKFRLIPPGEFLMGSTPEEVAEVVRAVEMGVTSPNTNVNLIKEKFKSELPRHRVVLTRPFYLGVHELRQRDYQRITGKNPSFFSAEGGGKDKAEVVSQKDRSTNDFPVDQITWQDTIDFCSLLNKHEGIKPIDANPLNSANPLGYSLPTEAQWEYACRAGTESVYWTGGDRGSLATIAGADRQRHRVEEFAANAFGLHGTLGNVFEFCRDWWQREAYQRSAQNVAVDPCFTEGVGPICRGGGFSAIFCRSGARSYLPQDARDASVGARVALSIGAVKELSRPSDSGADMPKSTAPATESTPVRAK